MRLGQRRRRACAITAKGSVATGLPEDKEAARAAAGGVTAEREAAKVERERQREEGLRKLLEREAAKAEKAAETEARERQPGGEGGGHTTAKAAKAAGKSSKAGEAGSSGEGAAEEDMEDFGFIDVGGGGGRDEGSSPR